MNLDPVILSIPIFFGLIMIEIVYEYFTRDHTYNLGDAFTNISTGSLQQVTGAFVQIITIGIYTLIYEHLAPVHLPNNWLTFIVLFVAFDFCYYWYHRKSHEISLLWGGHVVHHQSEHYNLSVALRQSSTSFFFAFFFNLPLAFLGFDPIAFTVVNGLNLLYQFWIHTEHIGKMGALELVMNTPSHHRVHHARDPKYIDKNYAGVFIVWDRMFGTFKEETEKPHYGVTKPLNSWNPIYANITHYFDLFKAVGKAKTLADAWGILFNKPGWMPEYLGGYQAPPEVPKGYKAYNTYNPISINIYVLIHFALSLGVISYYLFKFENLDENLRWTLAFWIALSTLLLGLLFEHKRWAYFLEIGRVVALPIIFISYIKGTNQIPQNQEYWLWHLILFVTISSIVTLFYFIFTKKYKYKINNT